MNCLFLRSLWFFLPSSLPIPMANPTVVTRPTMPWVDQIIKITHFNCITKSIYELCSTHPTTNLIGVWMTTIITPTTASTRAVTVTRPRANWIGDRLPKGPHRRCVRIARWRLQLMRRRRATMICDGFRTTSGQVWTCYAKRISDASFAYVYRVWLSFAEFCQTNV